MNKNWAAIGMGLFISLILILAALLFHISVSAAATAPLDVGVYDYVEYCFGREWDICGPDDDIGPEFVAGIKTFRNRTEEPFEAYVEPLALVVYSDDQQIEATMSLACQGASYRGFSAMWTSAQIASYARVKGIKYALVWTENMRDVNCSGNLTYPSTPTPGDIVAGPDPRTTPTPSAGVGEGRTSVQKIFLPLVAKKVYTAELVSPADPRTVITEDTEPPVISGISCFQNGAPCPTHDPNDPVPTSAPAPTP